MDTTLSTQDLVNNHCNNLVKWGLQARMHADSLMKVAVFKDCDKAEIAEHIEEWRKANEV